MFFGGTDTNLVEEREFLLDVRFTELNVHHLCTILYLAVMHGVWLYTDYLRSEAPIVDGFHFRIFTKLMNNLH